MALDLTGTHIPIAQQSRLGVLARAQYFGSTQLKTVYRQFGVSSGAELNALAATSDAVTRQKIDAALAPIEAQSQNAISIRNRDYAALMARRNQLNTAAQGSNSGPRQATVAADGTPIPIVYGKQRLGPLIFAVATDSSNRLVLGMAWCLGEIDAIESVIMDGEAVPGGVILTHYTGMTTQTADSTLAAAISGYADTLVHTEAGQSVGIAYTVAVIPSGLSSGFPRFEATIRGRKVYDPRDVGQDVNNAATWLYSNNPSLCDADFLRSDLYGLGMTVDDTSLTTAATANDETMADSSKRRTLNISMQEQIESFEWSEVLRTYAGVFHVVEGGAVKLVADRPATAGAEIGAGDIVQGSLRLSKSGLLDRPNVVRVIYTDTSTDPWRDAEAVAPLVLPANPIVSEVQMPGITSHREAFRFAQERLNQLTVTDLRAEWEMFDEALEIQQGDVRPLTHPRGLTQKLMRIIGIEANEPGRWRVSAAEYDPAVYSDAIVTEPTFSDTALPSPLNPPAPDDMVASEELFVDEGGKTFSRLRISWTGVDWPFARSYRVTATGTGVALETTVIHRGTVQHIAVTGPVKQDEAYDVEVSTASSVSVGTAATFNITAIGKQLKPLDVPSITGFEAGQFVSLSWDPSADIDLIGYRIKRGQTTDTFDTAPETVVSRVDATTFLEQAVPAGTWRYFIKGLDSLGQVSVNAAFVDIDVTADESNSVITNQGTLANATLTNMHGYEIAGVGRYAITSFSQTWAQRFGSTGTAWNANTVKPWALGHPDSADAFLETDEWDITLDRTGNWQFDVTVELLQTGTGVAAKSENILLATASQYPTFTTYSGRSTVKPGRYFKARIEDSGNNGDAAIRVRFPIQESFRGKEIVQTGTANIPASGQPLTVIFAEPYANNPKITLTTISTNPRIVAADSVSSTQFNLHAWDTAGAAAAATVEWVATGN